MIETPSITSTENERQHADFDGRAPFEETILRRLYSYMLKCRTVEERIRLLFRQGRFSGKYFAAVGQEATEVGATMDLLPEDTSTGILARMS
jgi:TPP-dependent pyruvate/acetoin dehydrogenase alpha subunit